MVRRKIPPCVSRHIHETQPPLESVTRQHHPRFIRRTDPFARTTAQTFPMTTGGGNVTLGGNLPAVPSR